MPSLEQNSAAETRPQHSGQSQRSRRSARAHAFSGRARRREVRSARTAKAEPGRLARNNKFCRGGDEEIRAESGFPAILSILSRTEPASLRGGKFSAATQIADEIASHGVGLTIHAVCQTKWTSRDAVVVIAGPRCKRS